MNAKIRLGTRASRLALWQAEYVKNKILSVSPSAEIEIEIIKTAADRESLKPISQMDGKGVFVSELEAALLGRRIDLAVHSLKDMSAKDPEGLVRAAYFCGDKRSDVLVAKDNKTLSELPQKALVACGSQRRIIQLAQIRDDLQIVSVRGNVDTRVKKLQRGKFDALVLAEAGVTRLGLIDTISYRFSYDEMVPAGGQGIIAAEIREDDSFLAGLLEKTQVPDTDLFSKVEMSFLSEIGAGCRTPIGVVAEKENGRLVVRIFLSLIEEDFYVKEKYYFEITDPHEIGREVARLIMVHCEKKFGRKPVF